MYIRTPAKLCSSGCSGFFGLLCLAPSVATLVVHFRFRLPVVSDGGSCNFAFSEGGTGFDSRDTGIEGVLGVGSTGFEEYGFRIEAAGG